jgi:hypothetical protein
MVNEYNTRDEAAELFSDGRYSRKKLDYKSSAFSTEEQPLKLKPSDIAKLKLKSSDIADMNDAKELEKLNDELEAVLLEGSMK